MTKGGGTNGKGSKIELELNYPAVFPLAGWQLPSRRSFSGVQGKGGRGGGSIPHGVAGASSISLVDAAPTTLLFSGAKASVSLFTIPRAEREVSTAGGERARNGQNGQF